MLEQVLGANQEILQRLQLKPGHPLNSPSPIKLEQPMHSSSTTFLPLSFLQGTWRRQLFFLPLHLPLTLEFSKFK